MDKDTCKKIVEVKVDGFPSGAVPVLSAPVTKERESTGSVVTPTRIWLELRMSTGLHITQKSLSYLELIRMIEKLEGLC